MPPIEIVIALAAVVGFLLVWRYFAKPKAEEKKPEPKPEPALEPKKEEAKVAEKPAAEEKVEAKAEKAEAKPKPAINQDEIETAEPPPVALVEPSKPEPAKIAPPKISEPKIEAKPEPEPVVPAADESEEPMPLSLSEAELVESKSANQRAAAQAKPGDMPTVKPPPPPPMARSGGTSGLRPQAPPTFVPSKTPAAGTKIPSTPGMKAAEPPTKQMPVIPDTTAEPAAARPSTQAKAAEPPAARPSASIKAVEPAATRPSASIKAVEPAATRPSTSMKAATPATRPSTQTKAAEPAATRPSGSMRAVEAPKPASDSKTTQPSATMKAAEPAPAATTATGATAGAAAAIAAKYAAPTNPETAELEKNDPRHAAARRLARLSVSEIKLYHEKEVTEGRANKDLWTRLKSDIALATQTFEKRVDQEVRDRFDYLYDEILRQLAEGDVEKLGADAPKKAKPTPSPVPAPAEAAPKPAEPEPVAAVAPAPAPAPAHAEPVAEAKATSPLATSFGGAEPAAIEAKKEAEKPAEPAKADDGKPAAAPLTTAAAIAAKYAAPTNPKTAELEKNDPRHAAARRLARLSVSEIKLYHEKEVTEGRAAKDLWKRLSSDIGLAKQTYEKRVDQEVRERFDYLYDEILRQLAEGDPDKLGPDAPKPAD